MPVSSVSAGELNLVDEYILALLQANGGSRLPGKIYLQKEMYLLQRAFPELGSELDFEPYFLGPHSSILEDEADQLARSGLIRVAEGDVSLTDRGKRAAIDAERKLPKGRLERIGEFKSLLNDLSNDELLSFIYFGYPDSEVARESAEYQRLSSTRQRTARSLYRRGKISAERAAELAGDTLEDFIDSVRSNTG
jgi:uncharacterized protein YwgA